MEKGAQGRSNGGSRSTGAGMREGGAAFLRDGMARGGRRMKEERERGSARADEAVAAAAVTAVATAGGARARANMCARKGERQGESREVGEGMSSPRCRSRVAAFDVI